MDRLTVIDEIFLRTHRGLGTPIALQGLWRTSTPMEPALLHRIHDRLRRGPLGRRVIRPRIPGARRAWQPTTRAHPLDLLPNHSATRTDWPTTAATRTPDSTARCDHTGGKADVCSYYDAGSGPLAASAISGWADSLGFDLDPEHSPGWRLSAAPLADGGTVVALTCSHSLADARGLIHAVGYALESLDVADTARTRVRTKHRPADHREATSTDREVASADPEVTPTDREFWSAEHEVEPADGQIRPGKHDIESVNRQLPPAKHKTESTDRKSQSCEGEAGLSDWADARAQWSTILGGTVRALRHGVPKPPPTSAPEPSTGRAVHSTLLTFDADAWDTTAAAFAGTPNSLFIYLVANILWENGFAHDTISASLPVDTRDEPRVDNDLAMTEIAIVRADTPATIRDKARAAYLHRMSSPAGLPEQILQVLPDRWAYALSKGAGERDILCSNIGTLPGTLRTIGPHHATRVAARAIHPGLTAFPRTRLSGYLSRLTGTYTLALVDLGEHDETFDAATVRVLAATGLHPTAW
ncbi:hypothetical protein ACFO5K_16370 [Nocardia halotolerans]|uniref:Condensation domain-containing protein n=1 Tax=Nocardia halotolerans TaxID=1755878 RepID=A0ABV8VIU2_9NOCA